VAPDVFSYRFDRDEAEPRNSAWFLMFFFPKALFFTMTTPAGRGEREESAGLGPQA
jgi:hypothetical protein